MKVAVPGGLGGVGRCIVGSLGETPGYEVIVLSRKIPDFHSLKARVFAVDYGDVDSLVNLLQEHGVDTVISCIQVNNEEAGAGERNLIQAAERSAPTKRFVSSDWGIPFNEEVIKQPPLSIRLESILALRKTGLQHTTLHTGIFADYFGLPHWPSSIPRVVLFVDVANREASIPGDGNDVVTFTAVRDVTRYVERLLREDEWDEETCIRGDGVTLNQVVGWAEEITGAKFKVTYDGIDKLKSGEVTDLPGQSKSLPPEARAWMKKLLSYQGILITQGLLDIPEEKSIARKYADIKPVTVKEVLSVWKGK